MREEEWGTRGYKLWWLTLATDWTLKSTKCNVIKHFSFFPIWKFYFPVNIFCKSLITHTVTIKTLSSTTQSFKFRLVSFMNNTEIQCMTYQNFAFRKAVVAVPYAMFIQIFLSNVTSNGQQTFTDIHRKE